MFETISVDTALAKGHKMLTYPTLIIIFGTVGVAVYFSIKEILPFWMIPVAFGVGSVFSWIYWSFMVTKWRLWAFENVRNVHELKQRAIAEKLIWADDSPFVKTEIRFKADKEKWALLQDKFRIPDKFEDDPTVPYETAIYYGKVQNFFEMLIWVVMVGMGVFVLIGESYPIIGILMIGIGGYVAIKEFKQATNNEPQIILNDMGMQTISAGFYKWSEIRNEEVKMRGSGKSVRFYFIYDHPLGSEDISIDDFKINKKELEKLMRVYRGRFNNKNRV